jgi:broad specificity phosphatase PhoE
MRLLLLRHGQTHGNTAGALDTAEPGLDLTELGHLQAEAAAQALAEPGVDQIFVSSLVRTHQTAAPLAHVLGVEPQVLPGLREIYAGDFNMRDDHDAVAGYIGTVAAWIEGRYDERMPGGESGHEFLQRYDESVAEIHRSLVEAGQEGALVVSHGAALRTWVTTRMEPHPDAPPATQPLHNTALVVLEGDHGSGWEMVSWQGHPVGGEFLEDPSAEDPTGDLDPDGDGEIG